MNNQYYFQIDILKALAIIAIILIHTATFNSIAYYLILNQAVPLFFVIMGFNMGASFRRRGYNSIYQMFGLEYFKSRFKRLLVPFLFIFIISAILGLFMDKQLYFGILNFIGLLPTTGPGNYFISIVLQFIIVFPILYYLYRHNHYLILILSFLISFLFEIISYNLPIFSNPDSYIYKASILRYIFPITLGLWALDYVDFDVIYKNKLIIIGTILSIIYILLYSFLGWNFQYFLPYWGTVNVLAFFYPVFLFILGMKYLPKVSTNRFTDILAHIGKASYHIFLVQIIFFGFGFSFLKIFVTIPKSMINYLLIGISSFTANLIIVLLFGLLFYWFDKYLNYLFNVEFLDSKMEN